MERPLVSVIIPVYNVEKYLSQCLDSVLAQTYSNIEVICVNDGSTDKTSGILRDYSLRDNRLFVIDNGNQGVSASRNLGLEQSQGEYIMFVDADDWIDLACINKTLDVLLNQHCDIVMFPYIRERGGASTKRDLFNGSRIFEGEECRRLARRIIGPINEEVTSPASLDSYGTIWGKLYKRNIIEGLKFVDLSIIGTAEDSLFNMFAFRNASVVGYCPDVYYHYRRNVHSSLTGGSVPRLLEKWKVLFAIISENFKQNEDQLALSNRIALGTLGLLINAYQSNHPYKEIKTVLNDFTIHQALTDLDSNNMPVHWRFFFSNAKLGNYKLMVVILSLIQVIRKRRIC